MKEKILQAVNAEFPKTVKLRRYFHQNPCLSFQEGPSADYICAQLDDMGIAWEKFALNGIVAHIDGAKPGPTIAFRADFDALHIQEPQGLEFASQNPGVMHACGHDSHVATVLSLARVFQTHQDWISGRVVFVFQYAEELPPGGAKPMIDAGCLQGVDKIYAFHVSDELPSGTVGICPGSYMAASDCFNMEFLGNGGHGSRPSDSIDTVSAAAQAITMLNSIISRFVSPLRTAVISVCHVEGGSTYNVIPDKALVEGTVRTYEPETAKLIEEKLEVAAKTAAAMYGAAYTYRYDYGYPATVNHVRESQVVTDAAKAMGFPCQQIEPTPVAEDFGYYLEKVPGALFRVGIYNEALGSIYSLHNSRFLLDEQVMHTALATFLAIYMEETK